MIIQSEVDADSIETDLRSDHAVHARARFDLGQIDSLLCCNPLGRGACKNFPSCHRSRPLYRCCGRSRSWWWWWWGCRSCCSRCRCRSSSWCSSLSSAAGIEISKLGNIFLLLYNDTEQLSNGYVSCARLNEYFGQITLLGRLKTHRGLVCFNLTEKISFTNLEVKV